MDKAEIAARTIIVVKDSFAALRLADPPESTLLKDLAVESIDLVYLRYELEQEFGCVIPDQLIHKAGTVQGIIDIVIEIIGDDIEEPEGG